MSPMPDVPMQFFNIAVETPDGDFELLEKVIEGANLEVDESEEERKGGAGWVMAGPLGLSGWDM